MHAEGAQILLEILLLCGAAYWLAYVNGANDNSKGVATLIGSGTLSVRDAIRWGTLSTLMGSITAIALSHGLITAFSGKGLLPDSVLATPAFLISVGIGSAGTIFIATRTGFPISTTHALVGGLAGVGLAAGQLNIDRLLQSFLIPLLVSPLLAALGASALHTLFRGLGKFSGITLDTCLCISREMTPLGATRLRVTQAETFTSEEVLQENSFSIASPVLEISPSEQCAPPLPQGAFGIHLQRVSDNAHLISAGAVSFARGLNDTPKIAALLLSAQLLEIPAWISLLTVGVFMAVGGMISSRAVAHTMSHEITTMDKGEGLAGNFVTAALVLGASKFG
ncbi:MAG: inorganic phosphate transporter, partial [Deltaproteobacteria bacterium]|nr:inorganic phosphate transporter [Deltaproteobacteria bacterium]